GEASTLPGSRHRRGNGGGGAWPHVHSCGRGQCIDLSTTVGAGSGAYPGTEVRRGGRFVTTEPSHADPPKRAGREQADRLRNGAGERAVRKDKDEPRNFLACPSSFTLFSREASKWPRHRKRSWPNTKLR